MRDGCFWRSLYGGSEVGWRWRVEGGMKTEDEQDANTIFYHKPKEGRRPQIQFQI